MDTMQQPKIVGYRQLTAEEAALMNQLKEQLAYAMQVALNGVSNHVSAQRVIAKRDTNNAETLRIDSAQPERWIAIARTHFQEGLMALTRAVAQPGSF